MDANNRPQDSSKLAGCVPSRRVVAMQRFEWLYDSLRDEVSGVDAAALGEVLRDPGARTAAQERALILLAMLGSARAEALLEWFDPRQAHWRVQWLHRLAQRECAKRRGAVYCASKSASTASGGRPRAALSPAMTTGRSISEGCSLMAAIRSSRLSVSSSRLSSL